VGERNHFDDWMGLATGGMSPECVVLLAGLQHIFKISTVEGKDLKFLGITCKSI